MNIPKGEKGLTVKEFIAHQGGLDTKINEWLGSGRFIVYAIDYAAYGVAYVTYKAKQVDVPNGRVSRGNPLDVNSATPEELDSII